MTIHTMQINNIKQQFPLLTNNPSWRYLDNASTTQKPQVVFDAISEYYARNNANTGRGNHTLARIATQRLEEARHTVADFIHAQPHEIIFTKNTTEGLNMLAYGFEKQIEPGDEILLTTQEHHSNLLPWIRLAKKKQAKIIYLDLNEKLLLDHPNLSNLVTNKTKIFAFSHISNVLGSVVPVRTLVEQIHAINPHVITVLDAAQSAGHLPLNVDHLLVDFIAFSGHKMYGPGVGVLWGKSEKLELLEPLELGGGMVNLVTFENYELKRLPARLEAGTLDVAQVVGLQAAIQFLTKIKLDQIAEHEHSLAMQLITQLENTFGDQIVIYGKHEKAGIVSFNIQGIDSQEIANYLDTDGIFVRSGHHCAMPLHNQILKINGSVRVSFGVYNDESDIKAIITSLQSAIEMLR